MSLAFPHGPAHDLFSWLPDELLLQIVKQTPSLSSLWSITQASPTVATLCNKYAFEIIEAVLADTVPNGTQSLIREVLRLQAASKERPSFMSLERARNLNSTTFSDPLNGAELEGSKTASNLPTLAHKIHMLTHFCIEHYVRKSMALRPAIVVQWHGYGHPYAEPVAKMREIYEKSESQRDMPRATGPPSWVEEQRVVRAFWILEFFAELKTACNEGRLNWTDNDLEFMRRVNLSDFYLAREFELEQILTVYEYIQGLGWQESEHNNYHLPDPPPRSIVMDNDIPKPCFTTLAEDQYQQGERWLDRAPMAYTFQRAMARDYKYSVVPGLPFRPYRKFGFALWDGKRMSDLGFTGPEKQYWLRPTKYYYTWYSILTEDERSLEI